VATPTEQAETPIEQSAARSIYAGFELGVRDASRVMASRYSHVVAVLGDTGAGKTCFLCALYLLASCGELRPRYSFAGSFTLPGFEARLRLLRSWEQSDHLPSQLVLHTELKDPRNPSLLHLRLLEHISGLRELLFTDLPGEWSQDVVLKASAVASERFAFLRRADALVLATDMGRVKNRETAHGQVQWSRHFFERIQASGRVAPSTPVIVMLTKCDEHGREVPEAALRIQRDAADLGFTRVRILPIVSFSRHRDAVASGTGISAVLDAVLESADGETLDDASSVLAIRKSVISQGRS
jgi:hypothetical protein